MLTYCFSKLLLLISEFQHVVPLLYLRFIYIYLYVLYLSKFLIFHPKGSPTILIRQSEGYIENISLLPGKLQVNSQVFSTPERDYLWVSVLIANCGPQFEVAINYQNNHHTLLCKKKLGFNPSWI